MRLLRETFLQPFKDAIQKANAISVMASYTKLTACRRTPANGCCVTCCARNGV